jgi:hypothetical protein
MVMGSPRPVNSSSLGWMMVQQHHTVGGERLVGHLEEVGVAVTSEMLEGADRHDAIHLFVELFPAPQQHALASRGGMLVQTLLHVRLLIAAQRQTDDVDVIALERTNDRGAPPAPDIEQCHPRLEPELT